MSEKINQIVEDLKTLTLLEASELVTAIEETFGVDASASASGAMVMAATGPSEEIEEKTEFDISLDEVPADTTNLDASSKVIFRYITSSTGNIKRNPLVGFGVVGTNTFTSF